MFSYLKGVITIIEPQNITLESTLIGFKINVSNPYQYELEKETKIFIYQHVREDEISLFGFQTMIEKNLFLDLISVKGIGPKTALLILAVTSVNEFQEAVKNQNIDYLCKFPKIGQKSAKQIILDLEKKYQNLIFDNVKETPNQELQVSEALISLGYDLKIIKKILPKLNSELPLEKQIKEALKLLLKI